MRKNYFLTTNSEMLYLVSRQIIVCNCWSSANRFFFAWSMKPLWC